MIENVLPINIGSKMLPNNNCMAMASTIKSTVTDIVGRKVTANTHIIAVEIIEPIICMKFRINASTPQKIGNCTSKQ